MKYILNTFASGQNRKLSCQNNRIAHDFAWKFLQSGKRYRPGKRLKDAARLLVCTRKKCFCWWMWIFCEWRHKWRTFRPTWLTSPGRGPKLLMIVFCWSFYWKLGYNMSLLILWMTCWGFGFRNYDLKQGWPTCGACAIRGALDAWKWRITSFWWPESKPLLLITFSDFIFLACPF